MAWRYVPREVAAIEIPEGRYFTKTQVAKLRGVTIGAVDRWIRFGYLRAVRAGSLGWLIEEKTLAAFTPPPLGPRWSNPTFPPLPEAEELKYLKRKADFEALYAAYSAEHALPSERATQDGENTELEKAQGCADEPNS